MGIYKEHLRELIADTLNEIDLYSDDAVNLLMGTAAQESHLGKYLKQLKSGPALGIFQMEPNTYNDILDNYLKYKSALWEDVQDTCLIQALPKQHESLIYNIKLAICMARIHYLRVTEPLPTDLSGYANYWKKYYNTYLGAGTTEEFIHNYKKYVL